MVTVQINCTFRGFRTAAGGGYPRAKDLFPANDAPVAYCVFVFV